MPGKMERGALKVGTFYTAKKILEERGGRGHVLPPGGERPQAAQGNLEERIQNCEKERDTHPMTTTEHKKKGQD